MALPKKNKDWAKDFESIWSEAISIYAEFSDNTEKKRRLYRMAPTLVCHQQEIDNEATRQTIVAATLAWVEQNTQSSLATDSSIKYSFALAYLQTHVQAKLINAAKAKDLVDYFSAKNIIVSELH